MTDINSNSVLVLGSKYNSNLPDLEVKIIYCANASAIKAQLYQKKYPKVPLVCCTTTKEFTRNEIVKEAIINSMPSKIVVRTGEIKKPENLENCSLNFMSNLEQRKFQYNFYSFGKLSLYLGEARYRKSNLKETLSYFYHSILENNFLGASTGLFSILLALKENVDSHIIISGIGLEGGPQFYKSNRKVDQDHSPRAKVDKYLINSMKKNYKKKIITLDKDMAEGASIRFWGGKIIHC